MTNKELISRLLELEKDLDRPNQDSAFTVLHGLIGALYAGDEALLAENVNDFVQRVLIPRLDMRERLKPSDN